MADQTGPMLIDRLLAGGKGLRLVPGDHSALLVSVLSNLRDVLGSRQGSALAQPDLGLPPPNELRQNYPASIADVQRAIAASITRYEPRLSDVQVTYVQVESEQLVVHFQINATLMVGGRRQTIALETSVDHCGQVRVEG